MISTVSLSFDLTYTDPITGTVIPRCVVTDSTTYPFAVDLFSAKGYGVLTFNGDVIEAKDTVLNPLINLEAFETTGFINLPLDNNGNVANGVYGFEYSLRLDSTASGIGYVGTVTGGTTFTSAAEWLVEVLPIGSSVGIDGVNNTVAGAVVVGSDAVITLGTVAVNGPAKPLTFNNNVSLQFSATYPYSGCTQTTADVGFIYDCEYGNSGTWSVSNATVLGATEIVTSLNCVINYPSWTSSNPLFNPQVITTVLPYPTLPGDNTPLATGTYSVSLSQQIQQTQASGLVVLYNNSVIKEFAVSCAGSLCGLIPCMENLRAAHATELIRNRISKYQVFVDNVVLYYIEAMNYRSCGELDRYRDTINLIQAQLDASGCDCACCDDNSYYWVSNNSANSIIDEILANFQFRLYTGPGAPSASEVGVELGALWQDTTTGILYRCTGATPGSLTWALYYDPSVVYPTGADNGLSISSGNVVLGGSLDNNTTIDLGFRSFDFTSTSGNLEFAATNGGNMVVSTNTGTAIDVTGTTSALKVEGTVNALDVTATNSIAGILKVQRAVDNTVAVNLALQTSVDSAAGANGLGSSIQFASESSTSSTVTTSSIQSVLTSASAPTTGSLGFNVRSTSGLVNSFNLNDDASVSLPSYGSGTFTGTPTYSLGVDASGNVVETTAPPKVYLATVSQSGTGNPTVAVLLNTTGETITWAYSGVGTYEATITNGVFAPAKTAVMATLGGYASPFPYNGALVSVAGIRTSNSTVQILSFGAPTGGSGPELANGVLYAATIRIEIYP